MNVQGLRLRNRDCCDLCTLFGALWLTSLRLGRQFVVQSIYLDNRTSTHLWTELRFSRHTNKIAISERRPQVSCCSVPHALQYHNSKFNPTAPYSEHLFRKTKKNVGMRLAEVYVQHPRNAFSSRAVCKLVRTTP
jgi:hypothetical protein